MSRAAERFGLLAVFFASAVFLGAVFFGFPVVLLVVLLFAIEFPFQKSAGGGLPVQRMFPRAFPGRGQKIIVRMIDSAPATQQ